MIGYGEVYETESMTQIRGAIQNERKINDLLHNKIDAKFDEYKEEKCNEIKIK